MAAKKDKDNSSGFSPEIYPYVECREQHVWKPYDVVIKQKAQIIFRIQVCHNCGMKKHTQISLHPLDRGQLIKSYYAAPSGYRIPGGIGVEERGAIRLFNVMGEAKKMGTTPPKL
jgi:hypothetical protein